MLNRFNVLPANVMKVYIEVTNNTTILCSSKLLSAIPNYAVCAFCWYLSSNFLFNLNDYNTFKLGAAEWTAPMDFNADFMGNSIGTLEDWLQKDVRLK